MKQYKKILNALKINSEREKKNTIFLLSFLLPLVAMIIILISKHVFPFGDRSILRTDFYHQYLPFYSELQYKLQNLKSLFYSYDVGLGTNFITVFAYYLSCPINILLFIVPQNFIIEFMTVAIVFKIALSGLTMSYYLQEKYKNDNLIIVAFSVIYAMSGYMVSYYWNIMWLDNILLFPLLMISFENAYNGKKPYLYIIILALTILCNYYIAAITCIFLIIYFVFYSVLRDLKIKDIGIKFLHIGIYSIIGILIASVLLVPVFYAFKTTASYDHYFPKDLKEYFTLIEAIGRHLPFTKVENGINYWPNIYSGVITFPLVLLYFTSRKIKLKEKICYGILLLFFLASFSINTLDFIWHIFKYPNSLPARQSFIYTFLLLTISIKPLLKMNTIKMDRAIKCFILPIVSIILLSKVLQSEKVPFVSLYVGIIFLFLYFAIFIKYQSKKSNKIVLTYLAIILVVVEMTLNMSYTSITTIKRDDYLKNVIAIREVSESIKNITTDYYRVERAEMKTKDDGAFLHFPSASIFSSSAYKSGSDFYKQLGMEASTNAYSITGSTPFMDALLSVKYKIFEKEVENASALNMRKISEKDQVSLYQNIDVLPLSFVLTDDFLNDYDMSTGNPATNQNNFSRTLNLPLMLDKKDVKINGINAKFGVAESGDYYAFVRDKGIKEVSVSYDTTDKKFKNLNRGFFIELGYLKAGTEIDFRNDTNESDLLIEVFRFNYESMKKVLESVKNNATFDIGYFTDTYIKYNLDVKNNGTCIVSLPYDDGFKVVIDGKEVEKEKSLDFFLSFKVDEGEHTVELSYMPVGFRLGVVLSLAGIIGLIALFVIREKYKKIL